MKTFCISLVICSAVVMLDAMLIESKVDGNVLTISETKVPPGGPYQRYGVVLRPAQNDSLIQQWGLEDYPSGQFIIGTQSKFYWNAISTGLAWNNGFAYLYMYNIGNVTTDNYRLLETTNMLGGPNICVKNPGNGSFHLEVECDINDEGQLWRFIE